MPLIEKNFVLSEILAQHHILIPIINRFGINLGVGNKTIESLCDEHEVNVDFLLTILNVYLNDTCVPDGTLNEYDLEPVAQYFNTTIQHYLQSLVPNIEKHLHAFISFSKVDNNKLEALQRVFDLFKKELTEHLEKGIRNIAPYPYELLRDIKSMLIKYVSGDFNQNLCYAVIFSVGSLEEDLIIHNRLRSHILKPMLEKIDKSNIVVIQKSLINNNKKKTTKDLLTKRQKEILKLIVKGNLNREIANILNISLNTVLTHRKNIVAKTGIKTVSGLTLYCISNGLLSPNEIKID